MFQSKGKIPETKTHKQLIYEDKFNRFKENKEYGGQQNPVQIDQGIITNTDTKNPVRQYWASARNNSFWENPFVEFSPLGIAKYAIDTASNYHESGTQAVKGNYKGAASKLAEAAVGTILLSAGNAATSGKIKKLTKSVDKGNISDSISITKGGTPSLAKTEAAVKLSNRWSSNWYNHPEFLRRYKKLGSDEKLRGDTFVNIMKKRVAGRFWETKPAFLKERGKNATVSGWSEPGVYLADKPKNYIVRDNPNTTLIHQAAVGVHEGGHGIMNNIDMYTNKMKEVFKKARDEFGTPEVYKTSIDNMRAKTGSGVEEAVKKLRTYWRNDAEAYANIQQLRYSAGLDPREKVTKEMMPDILSKTLGNFKQGYSSESIRYMLNTLPAAAGVGVGLKAFKDGENSSKELLYKKGL